MDPKKQGIVFEALTYCALDDLGYRVHWGVKPEGFTIDPDFLLGPIDAPSHWILVTSTGSAKEFDKKFWRNLAEMLLVKRFFKKPPNLVNLVYKQNQKLGLQEAFAKLSDADISVAAHPFGKKIIKFIEALPGGFPQDNLAKVATLRELINSERTVLRAFKAFKVRLASDLKTTKPELEMLWKLNRELERQSDSPASRTTSVRRGLAKLIVLPGPIREHFYEHVASRKPLPLTLPTYVDDLGFVKRSIRGPVLGDPEIRDLLTMFDPSTIKTVIDRSPEEKMDGWIEVLRNLSNVDLFLDFIRDNIESLRTAQGMLHHLQGVYADPLHGLDRNRVSGILTKHWLYDTICECIKCDSGKSQGFGYSQLIQTLQSNEELINAWLTDSGIGSIRLRGRSVLVRGLTDWVNRKDSNHARSFSESFQGAVAWMLSQKLDKLAESGLPSADDLKASTINTNLEKKIIPYRLFEPLPLLIQDALNAAGIKWSRVLKHPTFPGEYLGAGDSVACTSLIIASSTIVMWRSAPKNPRDKTKELASRVQALKFEYVDGQFQKRSTISKAILVVDGSFSDEHLTSLTDAGWDEIFYPDEMEQLAAAIE